MTVPRPSHSTASTTTLLLRLPPFPAEAMADVAVAVAVAAVQAVEVVAVDLSRPAVTALPAVAETAVLRADTAPPESEYITSPSPTQ